MRHRRRSQNTAPLIRIHYRTSHTCSSCLSQRPCCVIHSDVSSDIITASSVPITQARRNTQQSRNESRKSLIVTVTSRSDTGGETCQNLTSYEFSVDTWFLWFGCGWIWFIRRIPVRTSICGTVRSVGAGSCWHCVVSMGYCGAVYDKAFLMVANRLDNKNGCNTPILRFNNFL